MSGSRLSGLYRLKTPSSVRPVKAGRRTIGMQALVPGIWKFPRVYRGVASGAST